ncbi:MAG: hypothetical protein ACI956_000821, partial [Nonlabens sp.]
YLGHFSKVKGQEEDITFTLPARLNRSIPNGTIDRKPKTESTLIKLN